MVDISSGRFFFSWGGGGGGSIKNGRFSGFIQLYMGNKARAATAKLGSKG